MENLRTSLIQDNIYWEDKESNLDLYGEHIHSLAGKSDIAILPEMFTTGFSMNASHLAETADGDTINKLKKWSQELNLAICGSFLSKDEKGLLYNRGFFIDNETVHFYDKRHLFRMGEENKCFSPGNKIVNIPFRGWNIRLAICYDLRFPVWLRNTNNAYDLLIIVGNWPHARIKVWDVLLKARALENISYVCAVNRIGNDNSGLIHSGKSSIIDYKGDIIAEAEENKSSVITETLNLDKLNSFRKKFPAWMDADDFEIKY